METATKRRLGDICVERGLISQEQLQQALVQQSETGTKLGEVLVELGFVTRVGLAGVLSEQWNDLRVSQSTRAPAESSLALRDQVRALTAELAERDKRIAQQDATISALLSQIGDGAAAERSIRCAATGRRARSRARAAVMPPGFPSDRGGNRDAAACLLAERHVNRCLLELERRRDLVADPHGERLAERALVAEAREVDLQRLRLEAETVGLVLDRRRVEVGLVRDRAQGGQLVAHHLDNGDTGVREGLEPRVRVAAGVPKRDELLLHAPTVAPVRSLPGVSVRATESHCLDCARRLQPREGVLYARHEREPV
jgi:hypothetical protein